MLLDMRDHDRPLCEGLGGAAPSGRHRTEDRRRGPGPDGGGGDWFRIGRMLAHGDLKLLALALDRQQPRHGYELIKLIEERRSSATAPARRHFPR